MNDCFYLIPECIGSKALIIVYLVFTFVTKIYHEKDTKGVSERYEMWQ